MAAAPEVQQQIEALRQELSERESDIAMLLETGRIIGSELDLDTVLKTIAEHALALIKSETVLVPLLKEDSSAYTYRAGAGANAEEIVGETLPIESGLCGWVLRNQRPWWRGAMSELSDEERNLWEHEAGTVLLVPLLGRSHFLGGLACINKQGGGDFTQRDFALLQLFATQAAIAVENAMAMEAVESARREGESYQRELQRLNKRLNAANAQLEQMSLFDALTGLPNRTLFRDRARHEIETAQAASAPLAVLFIDLDKFQDINNSYGQDTGDALLKSVAGLLEKALGTGNTLSRVSGDEFAALVSNTNAADAAALARKLNEQLSAGVQIGRQTIAIGASVGIAIYPDHGTDLSALMKHADLAMNSAKRDRDAVHVYDALRDNQIMGRYALIQQLRNAIDQREFALFYQPKVDLASGRIASCEALARWPHPQRGMVPPDMFITALEQTNLILPFTRWVIETAARQHQAWRQRGWNIEIAVNVPPIVLMNPEFMSILDEHAPQEGLMIEITENVFLGEHDRLAAIMERIRERGIALSIDDYGTGYSSLRRLRRTPVSEVKIDRSFVKDMLRNKDDAVIVHSTIELAHNLGLRVVGEGVENAETLERLTSLSCDSVQGFHICRPCAPGVLEDFLLQAAWPPLSLSSKQAQA
jgi:diguanylate cyclase (GGDEF)-like protein